MQKEPDYQLNCSFARGSDWFRLRAAAIIIEEGCVLMVSNETVDYYYSIGGAIRLGETAREAVLREVLEETGVAYEIERLVFIHENIFVGRGGVLDGLNCHEIAFYFLMKARGTRELNSNSYGLDGKEFMNWLPISEFANYHAYPRFFKDKLTELSPGIEHLVTREKIPAEDKRK